MVSGAGAGAAIELPAPCVGALLPDVAFPCARDAEVVVWGPVVNPGPEGGYAFAWVFACRKHVRSALLMVRENAPEPELIETWGLEAFIERQQLGVFERAGIDAPRVVAAA